ncbi:MAG: hypothetical protein PHD01_17180 [Geobacteraceae bacterium]|nr:hypothetical protein [Geobacteraceae bacterium]
MRTKFILSMLIMTAVASTFGFKDANAGLPGLPGLTAPPTPNVNVSINGFLPAPPGVTIQFYGGSPCYVEHGRRVYLKEKKHGKHHKGHGHKYGHYKQK